MGDFFGLPHINDMMKHTSLDQKILRLSIIVLTLVFAAQYSITDRSWLVFLDNVHWTAGHMAAAVMAWIGVSESATAQQRVARRWFFVGITAYFIGQILWNVQVYIGWNPFPAPSDIGYLALGPCCLLGLLAAKRETPSTHNLFLIVLDAVIISISILALALVIYLHKKPALDYWTLAVVVAYPVMILSAFCFGLLVVLHVRPKFSWPWIMFQLGIGLLGLVWMWWNGRVITDTNIDGSLLNQLFSVASVVMGVSAMRWHMTPSSSLQYERWCEAVLRMLPLIGIAIAAVAYLWVLFFSEALPGIQNTVLSICGIVFILAVLRQSVMLKEHQQLIAAEKAVADSMSLLRTIVETAPIRIFWKDTHLNFLGCNTAFAMDAGLHDSADIVGKNDYQLAWAEQAEFYRADDRSVIDSGIPKLSYEEEQTLPSGKKVWLRTSKVPIKNQNNEPIGILGVYENITEYKRKEHELKIAATAFESHEGIMVTDANRIILRVNQAFTKITGYREEDVLGHTPRILSSGRHDRIFYDLMWQSIRTTGAGKGRCGTGAKMVRSIQSISLLPRSKMPRVRSLTSLLH